MFGNLLKKKKKIRGGVIHSLDLNVFFGGSVLKWNISLIEKIGNSCFSYFSLRGKISNQSTRVVGITHKIIFFFCQGSLLKKQEISTGAPIDLMLEHNKTLLSENVQIKDYIKLKNQFSKSTFITKIPKEIRL